MMERARSETLTIRLKPELRAKIEEARSAMPYQPTITSIVERGLELALQELERMKAAVDKSNSGESHDDG